MEIPNKEKVSQISQINKLIHEPVRLAICTILSSAREVDFNFLLTTLGLTKGNLATHLGKLEEAGYIEVKKGYEGRIPHTAYRFTNLGREEFLKYWDDMRDFAPGSAGQGGTAGESEPNEVSVKRENEKLA